METADADDANDEHIAMFVPLNLFLVDNYGAADVVAVDYCLLPVSKGEPMNSYQSMKYCDFD